MLPVVSRWIIDIIAVVFLAVFFIWGFGTRATAAGHSMEPILEDGDQVLLNKAFYKFREVERFDVVAFSYGEEELVALKRVVGLPGDVIRIKDGAIFINDEQLQLPESMGRYTVSGTAGEPVTLGAGEYFLLGDNGDSSEDSRFATIGIVGEEQFLGKVWFRIAPIRRLGAVES